MTIFIRRNDVATAQTDPALPHAQITVITFVSLTLNLRIRLPFVGLHSSQAEVKQIELQTYISHPRQHNCNCIAKHSKEV